MKHEYQPKGVCAQNFEFALGGDNGDVITDVKIHGGCQGFGVGTAKLLVGMKVDDVIERLEGIRCGGKPSSCPAQFAEALKATI
ncbi:MAG: TIGR03905 family TSCPD domain-containing protein [Oscillospiraceae bacterium]|nr:TIGR03905 family TSCPD domain-containing protein [Oscillospiraceae bacterium]